MKKILTLFLAVALILSLAACAKDDKTETPSTEESKNSVAPTGTSAGSTFQFSATVEEQVVIDEADIRVTVTGLEENTDEDGGCKLTMTIENGTDEQLRYNFFSTYLNNCGVIGRNNELVDAGETIDTAVVFPADELAGAGIEEIASIATIMYFKDEEENTVVQKEILIHTSAFGTVEQEFLQGDTVLWDENGVLITLTVPGRDGYIMIANTSGADVIASANLVSANGKAVEEEQIFWFSTTDGCWDSNSTYSLRSALEKNGVDPDSDALEELEIEISVQEMENWQVETKTVELNFN